jgi:hypothetical protein
VAKNAGEETLRVLSTPGVVVGVAERGGEDLDADLAGLRRRHLHVLDHERLVRLVRYRRFAGDDLTPGGGSHCFLLWGFGVWVVDAMDGAVETREAQRRMWLRSSGI